MPDLLPHFSSIVSDYDVLLCDVWGVVHNGVHAFDAPCEALITAREAGLTVVYITNAPRPNTVVRRQLAHVKVPRETYDDVTSSGDVTRGVVAARKGQTIFHLGPQRDLEIYDGMDVQFAPLDSADYVVCSGLDEHDIARPEDYADDLALMLRRKLFMLCGNPDVVVHRGDTLVYCAGALADLYQSMGGAVTFAGKPYRPIYDMALAKAEAARGKVIDRRRVLAIGDSVRTDLTGAHDAGLDFLFIASGIHVEDARSGELTSVLTAAGRMPRAVMHELMW